MGLTKRVCLSVVCVQVHTGQINAKHFRNSGITLRAQGSVAQVDTYAIRVIPITAREEGYSGDENAYSGKE
jgi:hypothetical protein